MTLGIDDPDHPVLCHRGYFAMYLGRMTPDELEALGGTGGDDFRRLRKMLSVMGQERLRELIAERASLRPPRRPAPTPATTTASRPNVALPPPAPAAPPEAEDTDDERPTAYLKTPLSRETSQSDVATILDEAAGAKIHQKRPLPEDLAEFEDGDIHGMTEYVLALANSSRYHDAFSSTMRFLEQEGPDASVLKACVVALHRASAYDRDRGISPVNVLHEFEHLAHALLRYCPDMSELDPRSDDEDTRESHTFVKRLYRAWLAHCRALLEFKFRLKNDQWMKRQWIEPDEFGILLDVFRAASRSNLPMDLMARNYRGAKECLAIADDVIVRPDKQARLKAEALRIFAPVFRERYEDLLFIAYHDIAMCYALAHDRMQALKFVNEAAAMRPHANLDEFRTALNEALKAPLPEPKKDSFRDLVHKLHRKGQE